MVHTGAIVAARVTCAEVRWPFRWSTPLEVRVPSAQRDWVGVGAAAGVAAAFNSPLGGILYSFEEVRPPRVVAVAARVPPPPLLACRCVLPCRCLPPLRPAPPPSPPPSPPPRAEAEVPAAAVAPPRPPSPPNSPTPSTPSTPPRPQAPTPPRPHSPTHPLLLAPPPLPHSGGRRCAPIGRRK